MHINTRWLRDYLTGDVAEADLLDAFLAAGLEIEEAIDLGGALDAIVIGFVREKKPLAGAEGMHACKIEVARGNVVDIVCASEHPIEVGWGVPVARAGVMLPSGAEIKEGKFHGQSSHGMICLDGELGLIAQSSGLQVFDDEALLGTPLPKAAPINESLVELSILPNRPDCLGMIGIAREVAAVLGIGLHYPNERKIGGNASGAPEVKIDDASLCPRYACQAFKDVTVKASPHWLKSRLLAAGQRPINNVVDITNFVMLEWGQPLHAFDFASLAADRIEIRRLRKGEKLKLLDGAEIDAEHAPLVIADAKKPIALAGIMGGADTQTTAKSREILLEAACFDRVCIRTASKKLGIRTESSYRFERGTDPNDMLAGAFARASQLLQDAELSGATPAAPPVDSYPEPIEPREFALSAERVSRVLGSPLAAEEIRDCLQKLEMDCTADLRVKPPTWRVDVDNEVVLAEDVARMRGYDSIELTPMQAVTTAGRAAQSDRLRSTIAEFLVANGFLECRNAPLTTAEVAPLFSLSQGESIAVANPMTTEMTTLRQSLLGSLVQVVERNFRRGIEHFKFFEIDRAFSQTKAGIDECWVVGGVLGGAANSAAWILREQKVDFLHAKGVVEHLLARVGVSDVHVESGAPAGYIASEAALCFQGKRAIGALGRVDQTAVLGKSRLQTPLYAFEIDLSHLATVRSAVRQYQGLARTPSITRDISIEVPVSTAWSGIRESVEKAFRAAAGELKAEPRGEASEPVMLQPQLEKVFCVDLYESKDIGPEKKSLTIRLIFRDPKHTLTSGEAQLLYNQVYEALATEHQARLR